MKKKNNDNVITDEERKTQDAGAVAEYNGEKSNRAKVVDFIGDDYEDVPVKDDSLMGRVGNFFYHYKWYLIIGALFLLIGIVGFRQMALSGKTKADLSVLYAGDARFAGGDEDAVMNALSSILKEDIDGDGERKVFLSYEPSRARTSAGAPSMIRVWA